MLPNYIGPMVVLLVPFQKGKGRWPNHELFSQADSNTLYCSKMDWEPCNIIFCLPKSPVFYKLYSESGNIQDQILRKNCKIWQR